MHKVSPAASCGAFGFVGAIMVKCLKFQATCTILRAGFVVVVGVQSLLWVDRLLTIETCLHLPLPRAF